MVRRRLASSSLSVSSNFLAGQVHVVAGLEVSLPVNHPLRCRVQRSLRWPSRSVFLLLHRKDVLPVRAAIKACVSCRSEWRFGDPDSLDGG